MVSDLMSNIIYIPNFEKIVLRGFFLWETEAHQAHYQ